jgi:hypothetical protein
MQMAKGKSLMWGGLGGSGVTRHSLATGGG